MKIVYIYIKYNCLPACLPHTHEIVRREMPVDGGGGVKRRKRRKRKLVYRHLLYSISSQKEEL